MTKTEYTATIEANKTAISAVRADLRKLRTIEKMAKSFPDLKLVDTGILDTTITAKKAELQKLRTEQGKARRIVKRMTEIEDIEAGKADEPKAKKSAAAKKDSKKDGKKDGKEGAATTTKKPAEKKPSTKAPAAKNPAAKPEAKKAEQPAPGAEVKENPAA